MYIKDLVIYKTKTQAIYITNNFELPMQIKSASFIGSAQYSNAAAITYINKDYIAQPLEVWKACEITTMYHHISSNMI